MAKVKLENIYKVYEGGVRAVNDFNLDIPDKEFVVFVGPSGCGKSTTLRMIAGLEDITQGKLYIDDEVVNETESKNRDIAMVFQNYALYPHMTVFQNMAFGLKLRHTPREEIKRRVYQAAEILEISELLTRKPKALSGGQRQRVALGRAIVREPKVFLLDEPLSNLDAKLRVQMRSEITKLHEKLKTTFIYVTHDQTEAMTMGSRIVVMKDGFIQQVDSPVALYNDPANLFVATFLGSPQMNILNAALGKKGNILSATLSDSDAKPILYFSEMKSKQLVNDSYIGKEVKFGIRPEAINIDENGEIEGIIDVVEQLGDETLYYCTLPGIKHNIIVKAPFKGRVKTKEKIRLSFNMDQAYLFDPESTNSILGVRTFNTFKAKITDNSLVIGDNKLALPDDLKNKILPSSFNKELRLVSNINEYSLNPIKDSIKLPISIEFFEDKTDYIAAFFKVKGLEEHFVAKIKLDSKLDSIKTLYIPTKNLMVLDEENHPVKSHEIIYPNQSYGLAYKKDEKLFVDAFGTTLEVKDFSNKNSEEKKLQHKKEAERKKKKLDFAIVGSLTLLAAIVTFIGFILSNFVLIGIVFGLVLLSLILWFIIQASLAKNKEDVISLIEEEEENDSISNIDDYLGFVQVEINPELVQVIFNKKMLKEKGIKKAEQPSFNLIKFEAYDEYKSPTKNFIYGKVKDMEEYATFYVDNTFSVYAMDKFKIHVPKKAISLKKVK